MDKLIYVLDRLIGLIIQGVGYIVYYPKTAALILVCMLWAFLGITWLMSQNPKDIDAKFLAQLKKAGKL